MHSVDGVEMLLEILNAWKKRQPGSTDEEECVENVFDALCSALVRAARSRQRDAVLARMVTIVRIGAHKS